MGRPRITWDAATQAAFEEMVRAGTNDHQIAHLLKKMTGRPISHATIANRKMELRGRQHIRCDTPPEKLQKGQKAKIRTQRIPPPTTLRPPAAEAAPGETPVEAAPTPETIPENVSEGESIERLDRWLALVERLIDQAVIDDNGALVASLVSKAAALSETRRKLAPPRIPDPNENPDMVAAAQRARARLHHLIVTSPEEIENGNA